MSRTVSCLYKDPPGNHLEVIGRHLEKGLRDASGKNRIKLFFRADDIGVPSNHFAILLELFGRHRIPLCLAVVPTWLTRARWTAFSALCDPEDELWCWHQHGFSHRNHEVSGKKCEFGPHRAADQVRYDIERGRDRLAHLMGRSFSPYFTPPWNRCSQTALETTEELGFLAVSRSRGAHPDSLTLPDFFINVDLHTRKEPDPQTSLQALGREFELAVRSGRLGIMLHHQRMNRSAFTFLSDLLTLITNHPHLEPVTFRSLRSSSN